MYFFLRTFGVRTLAIRLFPVKYFFHTNFMTYVFYRHVFLSYALFHTHFFNEHLTYESKRCVLLSTAYICPYLLLYHTYFSYTIFCLRTFAYVLLPYEHSGYALWSVVRGARSPTYLSSNLGAGYILVMTRPRAMTRDQVSPTPGHNG